jgi:hypothetical protein
MADNRLSTFLPNRSVMGAKMLQRPAEPYLRQQAPEVYGALSGLMGTAPDEQGSVLDPNTARARAGAEIGFPLGTALQMLPFVKPAAAGVKALGPTAGRMAEGYLQRQGLMPSIVPEAPQVPLSSMIEKPQAPVSPIGFYSAAEQAALALPRKSGTGDSFLNDLMKGQDVKKDELSWMGLDDYLKGKLNVTRQEVQDFIANNRVGVQERQLGGAITEDPVGIAQRKAVFDKYEPQIQALYKDMDSFGYNTPREVTQSTDNRLRALQQMRDAEADAFYKIPEPTPTKYQNYQLPGGENYREILLTLPAANEDVQKLNQISMQLHGKPYTEIMADTSEMAKMRLAVKREYKNQFGESGQNAQDRGMYRSSHFDQPNILAHMRVNDRIDADGKKMLLIEEVQSDWHQAGREKGYKTGKERNPAQVEKELTITTQKRSRLLEEAAALPDSEMTKFKTMNEEIKKLSEQATKLNEEWTNLLNKPEGVPDAPFKDTWHQLALKRALKYAADNGYDRVGLTTGKQQAERYDLSKQISKIYYSPPDSKQANKFGTVFKAFDSRGYEIINKAVTPEELPGIVGKEVAKKLLDAKGNEMGVKALDGIDLQIGGEGMKKYYDEIYPAFFEKQGKKYNAKTGETRIKTGQGIPGGAPVRYIDISPEMRGGVKKGQPLFTAAPIGGIGLGAGTQDQQQNSINSFIQ